MFKKCLYFFKCKNIRTCIRADQKGLTLIEVVIAFFIVALISLLLVQGLSISTRALQINRSKTKAMAIINEEIESTRFRDYNEVGIIGATGGDPEGYLESESTIDGYTVRRNVTWVDGEYSYKQVEITAINEDMNEEVVIVTQLSPVFGEGGPPSEAYPPPVNLEISGFWLLWWCNVELNWDAPETDTVIDYYKVWLDDSYIENTYITREFESIFDWQRRNHDFYVTVVYQDGYESEPSNVVYTDDL